MTNVVFDIGGTNLRVAPIVDENIGDIQKISTPQDPMQGIEALASLIKQCANGAVEKVAGGFPGAIADGVVIHAPNLPLWEGFAFEKKLSQALGGLHVQVRNDADLAALGEATYGAGRGSRVVGYIGIGTGVGGGRIVNGRIDGGSYGIEPGHQILDIQESADLESLVSGRAFQKRFNMHPSKVPKSAYDEMTRTLAVGIYNIILLWSPDVMVLGGSMMNDENGFRIREVEHSMRNLPNHIPHIPEFRSAALKDSAGLHGARALMEAAKD